MDYSIDREWPVSTGTALKLMPTHVVLLAATLAVLTVLLTALPPLDPQAVDDTVEHLSMGNQVR